MGKVPPATYYDSGMKGREEGREGGREEVLSRLDNGSAYFKN